MNRVTPFDESDDPFVGLKKVFYEFGYHKFTKILNASMSLASWCLTLLCLHYVIENFNKDLVIRYSPAFIVFIYIKTTMFISMVLEKKAHYLASEQKRLFWSINSAGPQARLLILKKASQINRFTYLIYGISAAWGIMLLPVFGSHREWIVVENVFDRYFGSSSNILYHITYSCAPFFIYTSVRHCASLFYIILQLYLQMFLINQHILQICNDKTVLEKLTFEQRVRHENETFKKLCFCIDHHVVITRLTKELVETVRSVMAFFLVLGVLSCISALYFMSYIYVDASNILKVRLGLAVMFNVLVVATFSHAGQILIDESSCNFDTLTKCSWYNWNKRNKTVLHIFMTNSLKPFAITFAGIVLDYKMAIAMFRTASSYALVFYNFQKAARS
ncbi:hypothetical protein MTP99_004078 [Tenebrio molitor]|nr:hypothetical protein MTP99_004078 [Tenebrio molitor]